LDLFLARGSKPATPPIVTLKGLANCNQPIGKMLSEQSLFLRFEKLLGTVSAF
jgi:hypothetical protein